MYAIVLQNKKGISRDPFSWSDAPTLFLKDMLWVRNGQLDVMTTVHGLYTAVLAGASGRP
jgi:hypothetical protein